MYPPVSLSPPSVREVQGIARAVEESASEVGGTQHPKSYAPKTPKKIL